MTSEENVPQPALHKKRRFPLIWILPIVALVAAGWLGITALASRGPLITIILQSAEGLEAGKTKIEHRDIQLGLVESITPNAGLTSVTVQARMNQYATAYLTEGTRFWVVRPRLSAEGISGLGTLISGAYIEMEPGPGQAARGFTGLEEPPVVSAEVAGTRYVLHGERLGSISQGAPVSFHGVKVGEVLGYELSDDDGSATIQVFVRAPHDKLVHEGTRFWNASGISVDVGSEGLRLEAESLESVLAGGVAFDRLANVEPGALAKPATIFQLYGDEDKARDAVFTRKVAFLLHLTGSAEGLSAGASVRMRGVRVGEVTDVHMEYDAATGLLALPVTFTVEPERIRIVNGSASEPDFEARAYLAFKAFVEKGLRARLASGNLLTGQKVISLDFVPDAPAAAMIEGGAHPEIPTAESSDLDSLMGSAKDLLASLHDTVGSLNQILTSPEVKRSLSSLDRSLANLDRLTHDASVEVGPLLAGLRTVSSSADKTLKQATATLAVTGDAFGSEGDSGGDLAGTLNELKQAARSLHVLTDYLENHPESLIQGRGGKK